MNSYNNTYYRRPIRELVELRVTKGKGNIYLKFIINRRKVGFILYDILYILGILINLISYSKLSRTKYPIKCIVDSIKIRKTILLLSLLRTISYDLIYRKKS